MEIVYILSSDLSRREKRPYGGGCVELLLVDDALYLLQGQISCDGDDKVDRKSTRLNSSHNA